jgi:hypothetical protein
VADYDRAIPPGGVGKITLTVNTAGYQGMITKTALVSSNDPHLPSLTLSLSANVRTHIVVEPSPRIFLSGAVGGNIRQVLHIHAGDDYPLEINGVKTNLDQWIHCKLVPKEGSHSYDLEVTGESAAQGSYTGYVQLLTNHPKKPEVTLPVYLRVEPALKVWPWEIYFGRVSEITTTGEKLKRTVTVEDNRRKGIQLKELRYNKDHFTVTAVPLTSAPVTKYRIEIVPRLDLLPKGQVNDTLIIKTDVERGGEIRVPVSIEVDKKGQP